MTADSNERILVVDDEADIVALVAYHLAKSGYKVSTASSGTEALEIVRRERPSLVVLDLMLPGISGYDVIEQLRAAEETRNIAVLMLTARRDESDRIRGLSLGADDYLTKPFSPQELVLRVGAILRRVGTAPRVGANRLTIGALTIDLDAHDVFVDGELIDLTATEFKLLITLAERRGRVQARADLLQKVWDAAPDIQTRTVDMHVQRLRSKLGVAGELIETARGFGYRIRTPQPAHVTLARRLLAGTLTLVALLVLAIVLIAGGRLRKHLNDELQDRLEREANLLASEWTPGADAAALATRAGHALGHRVTIVDSTGVVIGDSEFDERGRRALENHASRPEIVSAREAGRGSSRRHSVSAGDEELYVAVRHPLGFVRVSLATRAIESVVDRAQRDVVVSGLFALVGAMILTAIFARSISQPIVHLRDVAQAIAEGDLQRQPAMSAPGEVGDLATALSRMAEQLAVRLAALEADEQLMIAVLESLDEGLLALDSDAQVVRINERGRALLRVTETTPFPHSHLPDLVALRMVVDDALSGRGVEAREIMLHGRTLAVASRPLSMGGAVVTLLELTALRRLETVRRDFVANVSHELKTPLTAVTGYAETLLDETLPSDVRSQFVQTIRSNAGRMQRIVDDLLDLSRIESGGWHPQLATMDAQELIDDVIATCRTAAAAKHLSLVAEVGPDVPQLRADPTAARQVLINLIENAIRHTAEGRIVVRAQRWTQSTGVRISVEDTGEGIPPDHLHRIFERFYRVDAGRSRDLGGTGLGLAIVKHLVEAHNGDVDATSQIGKGTEINVVFPGTSV